MEEEWLEEEEALVSASITDEQLAVLSGSSELGEATFLQMTVDAAQVPLGTLGERMPNLQQLKLSGSSLPSIRELGTSLRNLQILWLCRCGLSELDGLAALPVLQEIYLAFNNISQLSPLTTLEELQVLDLEANAVNEMESVEWLQMLPSLQELTLRGNPICDQGSALRSRVLKLLPNLATLDDEDVKQSSAGGEARTPGSLTQQAGGSLDEAHEQQQRELNFVTEAIKKAEVPRVFDIAANGHATIGRSFGANGGSRPVTAFTQSMPTTALVSTARPLSAAAWPGRRAAWNSIPSSARRPGSRGSPAPSRPDLLRSAVANCSRSSTPVRPSTSAAPLEAHGESASELTMGGDVICGVGALRRHKLNRSLRALDGAPPSTASSAGDMSEASESVPPLGNLDDLDSVLLDELRALKMQQLLTGEDALADPTLDDDTDGPSGAGGATRTQIERADTQYLRHVAASGHVGHRMETDLSSEEVTPTQTPSAIDSCGAGQQQGIPDSPASRYLDLPTKEAHRVSSNGQVDILSLGD
mmetsp:Transcript_25243/g.76595  ORF Transcript_25243/g.76595 Transcript_25243/m.76595 type:complete len:531 (+) Transcript_25243:57-1649(+)